MFFFLEFNRFLFCYRLSCFDVAGLKCQIVSAKPAQINSVYASNDENTIQNCQKTNPFKMQIVFE